MESLLRCLNELSLPGPYSDEENQKIAGYLLGKAEFETIAPFLKKTHFGWGYKRDNTLEVGREAARDRELLPKLGRLLRIVRRTTTVGYYCLFISDLAEGGGGVAGGSFIDEVYVKGGLGIGTMLDDILERLSYDRIYSGYWRWIPYPELSGYENRAAFFAAMHGKYPEEFGKYMENNAKLENRIFTSIYLYTHDPDRNNEDRTQAVIACGANLINMANKPSDAAFEAVRAEPYFAGNSDVTHLIARLHEAVKNDKTEWEGVDKQYMEAARRMFYFASALSPSRYPLLDLINYIFMYSAFEKAFECLSSVLGLPLQKHGLSRREYGLDKDKEDFYACCLPRFEDGSYPKDRFLAYFAQKLEWRKKYHEPFYKLLRSNEEAALKALSIADGDGGVFIMNAFWEQGMHQDKAAVLEEKLITDILEKKSDAVADYFLGKSAAAPKTLPKIDLRYYKYIRAVSRLSKVSSMPSRIFAYAIVHKQMKKWLHHAFRSLTDIRGFEGAEVFFDAVDAPAELKMAAFADLYIEGGNGEQKVWLKKQVSRLSERNPELIGAALKNASAKGKYSILAIVYGAHADYNPKPLIECLADGSRAVRDLAVEYLSPQKHLRDKIEPLTRSKKKETRECAEKLLLVYGPESKAAESGGGSEFDALAYCCQHIPASAPRTIAWTEFKTLPRVRLAGTETEADDRIVLGYIYLLVTQTDMALPAASIKIRESLDKNDLGILGERLYHIWKENGALARQRGVLVLAAIDGNDAFVSMLRSDIQNWALSSRGALAADAVKAMALQGGSLALMTVDAISKKVNNRQVQRAGEEAFQFAADQLGVDPEVLADRIVPNLGFDSRGEQVIDYGGRSFIAAINPALQINLKTAGGKAIKSLPAPGANDDAAKAAAARTAFAAMKKNLKSVAAMQCQRLELALCDSRTWTKNDWTALFVENPIMNMFAIGLIWGVYDAGGKLIDSFRYMEDGSFTNVHEDEITLADDAAIGLCHPLDLGDEIIAAWTKQLSDYEIKQPVEQLGRKVFRVDGSLVSGDENTVSVNGFGGAVVYAASLVGKLQNLGWRRDSAEDGGFYYNFYKVDKKRGIVVNLSFSGVPYGADAMKEVTVYNAMFYKVGTGDRVNPPDVPPRLYSEICYDIERAAADRIRTDENWRRNC